MNFQAAPEQKADLLKDVLVKNYYITLNKLDLYNNLPLSLADFYVNPYNHEHCIVKLFKLKQAMAAI